MAHELCAAAHDVAATRTVAAPARTKVQQGVVGDVAGGHGLAVDPGAGEQADGDQRGVLEQLLGVFRTHTGHVMGNEVAQTGYNFIDEDIINVGTHGGSPGGQPTWTRVQPLPPAAGDHGQGGEGTARLTFKGL
ncbi:MAG: hypothetical protein EB034_10245 [Verrucomicrobia bacterium]|nr:hypothetical protein [Verrucomicrobiota bacterium]